MTLQLQADFTKNLVVQHPSTEKCITLSITFLKVQSQMSMDEDHAEVVFTGTSSLQHHYMFA